jgi:hypothetical protein
MLGIMMFSSLVDPTQQQEASWLSGASALFVIVSGHLSVNNVGCWAFLPFLSLFWCSRRHAVRDKLKETTSGKIMFQDPIVSLYH